VRKEIQTPVYSLLTGTLLAHPSTDQLLYMKEEKEMYETTQKWHMSTCKKNMGLHKNGI
jgi:hypothetical protein